MKKVIINADDFGLTNGINEGTIKAYKCGIVTSATLMTNGTAVEEAIKLARENPDLGVGIHFVLTYGKALTGAMKGLTDGNGCFLKMRDIKNKDLDQVLIERELRAQLDKFLSFGIKLTHFDSHHHVHGHPDVYQVVKKLALEYGVPIRRVEIHSGNDVATTDVCIWEFYDEGVSVKSLLNQIEEIGPNESIEIMVHPGYVDDELVSISSYTTHREKELEILTSSEIKEWFSNTNVKLVCFKDI